MGKTSIVFSKKDVCELTFSSVILRELICDQACHDMFYIPQILCVVC